tara:strand:+ start:243 stop:1832 length:1590 start_codon:yes stop_codon:yes gene_type:complete
MDKKTQSPLDKVLPNLNRNPYLGKDNEFDDWNVELQTRSLAEMDIGPDDRIVLCVGDSFTFGDGVYYKNTWTNHLQEGVFKDYKVINVGICGASNTLITNTLSKWCNLYPKQIELVIIGFSFSHRRTYFSEFDKLSLESSVVNLSPGNDWNPQKLDIIKKVNNATDVLHTSENDQSDFERNLLLVKGLAKLTDFKVYWWTVDDLGNERYIEQQTNALTLDSDDFVYMNVSDIVNEICIKEEMEIDWWHTSSPLRISEDNGHWSAKGHQVLADAIAKFIKKKHKVTWMFGTTSPFSREIIDKLDNPVLFGRHNVNYQDPKSFVEKHIINDFMKSRMDENDILNIIVNVSLACANPNVSHSLVNFKDYFMSISDNLFFFFKLLVELNRLEIPVRVCYVTSTFGNSTRYDTKSHLPVRSKNSNNKIHSKGVMISSTFKYATVRLAQQQTYTSNISPTCRVVGVNPSGLSGDNMGLYAKKMANMLYADFDDEQWNRIHCLQEESWYGHKIDNDDIVKMFNWALELEEQPQPQD